MEKQGPLHYLKYLWGAKKIHIKSMKYVISFTVLQKKW